MDTKKCTTAAPMIKLKINLNNKLKEFYELQIKRLLLQKESMEMDIQNCRNRISAISSVNRIETLQLEEFDPERQKDINDIINDTNEMNLSDYKMKQSFVKEFEKINIAIRKNLKESEELKNTIPQTGVVINYAVKTPR